MDDQHRITIEFAIAMARDELSNYPPVTDENLIELYEWAKRAHDAAGGIWTAVVEVLRARKGLDKPDPTADTINLEELFANGTSPTETSNG